jgi:benzoylformate decarboxylase
LLPPGAELIQITCDPDEAARAPMGDAVVGDLSRIPLVDQRMVG